MNRWYRKPARRPESESEKGICGPKPNHNPTLRVCDGFDESSISMVDSEVFYDERRDSRQT